MLTEQARQGIFRFFPGAQNQNAAGTAPTVDALGNPVRPAAATDDLRSINVFGKDPLRLTMDSTGWVQRLLTRMPLPNNFRTGDGLNTAGIFVAASHGRKQHDQRNGVEQRIATPTTFVSIITSTSIRRSSSAGPSRRAGQIRRRQASRYGRTDITESSTKCPAYIRRPWCRLFRHRF